MAPSAAATEFRATLGALGITQTHIARWFNVSQRSVRRWRDGTRRAPCGIIILVRLLAARMITIDQIEQVTDPIPTRANSSTNSEPLTPVEPAPKQSASARAKVAAFADLSPAAAAVVALDAKSCHWPLGDPQGDFCFCADPVVEPPYCERHRKQAYLAPRTGGVRVGFVAHWRPTGASRPPKILLDR